MKSERTILSYSGERRPLVRAAVFPAPAGVTDIKEARRRRAA